MYLPNEETVVTIATPEQSPYLIIADAIRRGAKLRPQCTRYTFTDGRSCVIGALAEGLGYRPVPGESERMDGVLNWIDDKFPSLWAVIEKHSGKYLLGDWLWHSNDMGFTREEIADRVEAMARK